MCVDSHINLRVVFVMVTTFYTLVNMRSIYFFRVALVIVICPPLCRGRWLPFRADGGGVRLDSVGEYRSIVSYTSIAYTPSVMGYGP